jgi:hypothetical protein
VAIINPGEQRFVAPVVRDEDGKPVLAQSPAFIALDPQHVELADQVECGTPRSGGRVVVMKSTILIVSRQDQIITKKRTNANTPTGAHHHMCVNGIPIR